MRWAVLVVLLLVAGGASAHAGSAPGANGAVVFVENDGSGHAQIWTAASDGTGATQLTTDATNHYDPKWSRDGSKIVYTAYPTPTDFTHAEIYVLSLSSPSSPTQLTSLGGVNSNPVWSADGTKIAFTHACNVWVMNADGSSPTQLTNDSTCDSQPTWSPDGTEIAYGHQVSGGDYDLVAIKTDGSGTVRTILSTSAFEGAPAWSPDGSTIVFAHASSASGSDYDIETVPAAGGSATAITSDGSTTFDLSPGWSPDSTQIIWSASGTVKRVPVGGGTPTTVIASNTNAEPDWAVAAAPTSVAVTRFDDPAGAGSCPTDCSLRQAVAAVATGGAITLPAGTYRLTQGQLLLDRALRIVGAGSSTTTIQQTVQERVLDVSASVLTLTGVTVTGGDTLATSTDPNRCTGGGIWLEQGTTSRLTDVTVTGNHADCDGGGIEDNGTLSIDRSTISANTAGSGFGGGGMHLVVEGALVMRNTVVASNTAGRGGGIDAGNSGAQLAFVNDTIAGNSGPLRGDGVDIVGAPTSFVNTILDRNGTVNCTDLGPSITSGGNNLSSDATCPFTAAGDRESTDAQLDASFVPQAGSPAIDAGSDVACQSPDRAGTTRPQGSHCDIGAFEVPPASGGGGGGGAAAASFTTSTSGLGVTVDASGSTGATSYTWSFGDGSTASGSTASHTYPSAGSYTITLTVSGSGGSATASRTVTVSAPAPPAPSVAITASPSTAATHAAVTLSASITDGSGAAPAAFTWAFGDGTTVTTTGGTVTHRWAQAGTYGVSVTVVDANGRGGSGSTTVTITAPQPHVALNVAATPPAATVPTATKSTRLYLVIPAGQANAATVSWSFGDGTTASGTTKTADHTYAAAGTYTATVTETDTSGATLTASKTFSVAPVQLGPPDPARSTIAATRTSLPLGQSTTITVELRDTWGRVVPGVAVTVKPDSPTVAHTTPLTGTTNMLGRFATTVHSDVDEDVVFSTAVLPGNTATITWGPLATAASILVAPAAVPADGATAATATVKLTANGAPVRNKLLQLELRSAGPENGTGTLLASDKVPTDATGHATFALTSDQGGSFAITIDDLTDGKMFQKGVVVFTATPGGPVDASASSISVASQLVAADGAATTTVRVRLLNTHLGPVPSEAVTLHASDPGVVVTPASATTDATGVATFTVASKTALTTTFTALDTRDGTTVGPSPAVQFYAHVADAATSSLTVSPAALAPGGTSTVTVTVRDAGGAPIAGQPVSLEPSDPAANVHALKPQTTANGIATFFVSTPRAETLHVRARAGGLRFGDADILFSNAVANAAKSSVTVSKSVVDSDGQDSAVVTVTVRSAAGTALTSDQIALRPNGGSSQVAGPNAGTAPGQRRFIVSDRTDEPVTYTAVDVTDGGIPVGSVNVTFAPRVSKSQSSISAAPATARADGTTVIPVTVTVHDAEGHPAAGRPVSLLFSQVPAAVAPFGAAGSGQHVTDGTGVAVFQLRATKTESAVVSAQVDGVTVNASPLLHIVFNAPTGGAPSASKSTIGAPASVPTGPGGATVTVQLRNASGGAVAGHAVSLTTPRSHATIRAVSATTNASGIATFHITDAKPESATLQARDSTAGLVLTQSPSIAFYTPGVDPAASQTSVWGTQTVADGVTPITVTAVVRDAGWNPLPGRKLVLHVTGSASPAPASATSDANGSASFKVTDATAEAVTVVAVDAASGKTLGQPVVLTFAHGISGELSTVTVDRTNVASNGKSTAIVTVSLHNTDGIAVLASTKNVQLDAAPGSHAHIVASSPARTAAFTVTDSWDETVTFTARDATDGVVLVQTVTVTFAPPAVESQSSIDASPTAAATGSPVTITAVFRDANGAPTVGKSVQLHTANGSGATAVTDATGTATFTLKRLQPGPVTVWVEDLSDSFNGPGHTVQSPTVTVTFS